MFMDWETQNRFNVTSIGFNAIPIKISAIFLVGIGNLEVTQILKMKLKKEQKTRKDISLERIYR